MNRQFRVSVCQLRTEIEQEQTMAKARELVLRAADGGADFAVLPEMYNCPYSREYFKPYAARGHAEAFRQMSEWAKEAGIYLIGGSVPETEDGRIYNTSFVYDRTGACIAKHRKLHLVDMDLPGMRFRETSTFSRGESITLFDTEFGRMGVAVCFDVRFPELFRAMTMRGAELVFLPSQFNMLSGPVHWLTSLRARAIDNQIFMVGTNAARYEGFHWEAYGHSAIVGPMGEILCEGGEGEQLVTGDIDLQRVEEIRKGFPLLANLRPELYAVAK